MDKNRLTAYLLLLTTAILWGIAAPVIKVTVAILPSFTFLFYRFLIVSILFFPIFIFIAKREKETLKSLLPIVPLGFLGVPLCLVLVFLGFERTTAIDGSLITAITPILIVIAGVAFLKEKVTKLERVGLAITVSGSVIIILQPLVNRTALSWEHAFGNFLILLSGVVWTSYVILSKVEFKKHSPFIITAVSFFTGLVIIAPLALFETNFQIINSPFFLLNSPALGGVLYMAIPSSIVAYLTFELGLKRIEASEATVFAYLQPVFAAPLAFFWLGEKISSGFLIGACVIVLGIILAEYQPRLAKKSKI